jgi:hypothetical protein
MWRLLTREFNFRVEARMQFNKVGVPHGKPIGWVGSTWTVSHTVLQYGRGGATAVPYRIHRHEMLDANDTAPRLP